jgi:hypothetical protein
MKNLFLLPLVLISALPVSAGTMSFNKKVELCSIFAQANADGVSGKAMLRQMLVQRGQPAYMANVIFDETRDVCPRAY